MFQEFIVKDSYNCISLNQNTYQSELSLENELILNLVKNGYHLRSDLKNNDDLYLNIRNHLSRLNNINFTKNEWKKYCQEYLDVERDGVIQKTIKVQEDYIYDLELDNGSKKNLYLFDKENIHNNQVEVIRQYEQEGSSKNIYDVTILINGIPLVHIELKRRGVELKQAFNQIHRYSKETFNNTNSLYKFLQLFVISNGTFTKYFANTTTRDKQGYCFTMNWTDVTNNHISDLQDFTQTFLTKTCLLKIIFNYCIIEENKNLIVMRPYQIAASERIIEHVKQAFNEKLYGTINAGGYVWHTTGSGKTITSFKVAQDISKLSFIDKVVFVYDRKDLTSQSLKKFKQFDPESITGTTNTRDLIKCLENSDNKMIVTTMNKLGYLIKNNNLDIYDKHVVFIFDEAHRTQFGIIQEGLKNKFKYYYQFGFTGTPIFKENSIGGETTESVFCSLLHSYTLQNALKDKTVLKFKVDYINLTPQRNKEQEDLSQEALLLHPERIKRISNYILDNYQYKTNLVNGNNYGFNAIFAVSSIQAAKIYYEMIKELQKFRNQKLKVFTIFTFAQNEEQDGYIEETEDINLNLNLAKDESSKEFFARVIQDYNETFKTNFSTSGSDFALYYDDVQNRVKKKEIDIVIVVNMLLTGFDSQILNTLFIDKKLKYHGLIQAFSRTNRIYNDIKRFGNIVSFQDLSEATNQAIALFGDNKTKGLILEQSFLEKMEGLVNEKGQITQIGLQEIIKKLREKFPNPSTVNKDSDKKEFVKLFGKYLQEEACVKYYDEYIKLIKFHCLKEQTEIDLFKEEYNLSNEKIKKYSTYVLLTDREKQDYLSLYNDILGSPEYRELLNTSIDNNEIADIIKKEIEIEKNIKKLDAGYLMFDPVYAVDRRYSFMTAKSTLGSVALHATHNAESQKHKLGFIVRSKSGSSNKKNNFDLLELLNIFESGRQITKEVKDILPLYNPNSTLMRDGKPVKVSDILSQFMNATVDAAKDDYITSANFDLETVNVALMLVRLGVNPREVLMFISNPAIVAYTDLKKAKKDLSYNVSGIDDKINALKNKANSNRFEQQTVDSLKNSLNTADYGLLKTYLGLENFSNILSDLMNLSNFDTKGNGKSIEENVAFDAIG